MPSKSLIFFAWWHTLERKLGGSLCSAVVCGCVMKLRHGRYICLQDRARDHGSVWHRALPELLCEALTKIPSLLGSVFVLLCQALTCTTRCFLCKSQAKASCSISAGLHPAWRGMPGALPRRAWSRGALTFFGGDVRPCNDSIPSGANPKSLFDW